MKTFITTRVNNRFKAINVESIAYVDFVSMDKNPEEPERCSIFFINGDKSLTIDNPADTRAILGLLQGHAQCN